MPRAWEITGSDLSARSDPDDNDVDVVVIDVGASSARIAQWFYILTPHANMLFDKNQDKDKHAYTHTHCLLQACCH